MKSNIMAFFSDYSASIAKFIALAGIFISGIFLLGLVPEERMPDVGRRETASALLRIGTVEFPHVSAEGVFVERMRTEEALFAKDAKKSFAPASLVKLMTALLFIERVEPLEIVSISAGAKDMLESDEKRSSVISGDTITAEDLLKLIVAESDNDAAYAAAEEVVRRGIFELQATSTPARVERFVSLMNEKREVLGLSGTHFANPSGRDAPENYTTAEDLARLARAIYDTSPRIWDISRLFDGHIFSGSGRMYQFENTNQLLKEFPAIYGSKTGFTDEAGGALLMLYEFAPRDPIVVVILKSQDRFGDGRIILKWIDSSFSIRVE